MRRMPRALGAMLAVTVLGCEAGVVDQVPGTDIGIAPVLVPGQYIVVLRDDAVDPDADASEMGQRYGLAVQVTYGAALKGFAASMSAQAADRVRADPRVQFVQQDQVVQLVGLVPIAPGDSAPTGVRRIVAATTSLGHEASNAAVAVIDTGVDLTNPELNVVSGKNCIGGRGAKAQDDHGHGTHVAGTIGAKNNGLGVIGVAPGTSIVAVKVLDKNGSGSFSSVACGIDFVTKNARSLNIKVANMSLGGGGSNDNNCGNTNNDVMHKAICGSTQAGVTYAVAAGNSSRDFATFVPAAYPEVLAVTAMVDSDGQPGAGGGQTSCSIRAADDSFAFFSNFAVNAPETDHVIAGPGVCITSTVPTGNCALCDPSGYKTISGTSMATPHLTGSLALCIGNGGSAGACAGLAPADAIQRIRSDAATKNNTDLSYGFLGDPNHCSVRVHRNQSCPDTKKTGFLAFSGGY